ncbi:AAA family ATPase [Endozoicomonas ascidiicola]|uniref:AAA family ATPase n=1 Tax=Endozoicomonas ascidiicola TaxID=1698521 RepID=UPI000A900E90|nr:AAA family ATPase [Endozoicomonas ascidiicola]
MMDGSKYDFRDFIEKQLANKKLLIDENKRSEIVKQINSVVANSTKFTDWNVKNNIQAELRLHLRSLLDKHQLPILDEIFNEVLYRAGNTGSAPKSFWFVGASYDREDQTQRFLDEGIWQNGYEDKHLDLVSSMQPGDLIAIKSAYTRKRSLPFDNREQTVSVMGIKVVGVIKKNRGDGRFVDVEWQPRFDTTREWYFYTHRGTIWRVTPDEWDSEGLINFAFHSKPQDIDRFRNAPKWKDRFGDMPTDRQRFKWTPFYEAVAGKLLGYKDDRSPLLSFVTTLADELDLSYIKDKELNDICPFTTIGLFNRGITDANRSIIAKKMADFLGVTETIPESFEGIPVLNNQKSWFFASEELRQPDDIQFLWDFLATAIHFSDSDGEDARLSFSQAYDQVSGQRNVGWNITMALYWIRPWSFLSLDSQSKMYIAKKLDLEIGKNGHKKRCSAKDYLTVLEDLEPRFKEDAYPVHSFPELSLAAWHFKDSTPSTDTDDVDPDEDQQDEDETPVVTAPIEAYSIDDIIEEGCFLERDTLQKIVSQLKYKKNLILQGPPGTGKTWLAKKLAFALMGQKSDSALRAVQFHPNLSYEDFVRGWRPAGDGKLSLIDGPFLEMINQAKKDATTKYVVVIEEINRGNPAQIFGEMLTLLEADKRTPSEALELSYRRIEKERVHIPNNLYVIGTMNIADRSLALVDLALRRRFAFYDLQPTFGKPWRNWVHDKAGIEPGFLEIIEQRLTSLNEEIAKDKNLGPQFKVGHSYVTPAFNNPVSDPIAWYKGVVESEVGPLLEEYWFDDTERALKAQEALVEGL